MHLAINAVCVPLLRSQPSCNQITAFYPYASQATRLRSGNLASRQVRYTQRPTVNTRYDDRTRLTNRRNPSRQKRFRLRMSEASHTDIGTETSWNFVSLQLSGHVLPYFHYPSFFFKFFSFFFLLLRPSVRPANLTWSPRSFPHLTKDNQLPTHSSTTARTL